MTGPGQPALPRSLGLVDAVVIGLGSMVGAGIFAALAPAAAVGGTWLLVALALAAAVAYCNATSSARLAARYPVSGGTYVYGRERLGAFWGHTAGWSFVVGKTASCAAMALTVGSYAWPAHSRAVAVGVVAALTVLNVVGIQRTALLTRVIVGVVLAVLATVVVTSSFSPTVDSDRLVLGEVGPYGVLQAAGLLFFAFAGYARIATLGEEVRDPGRTIPRAIGWALGLALLVYVAVATSVLAVLGADDLATATAPLVEAVRAAGWPELAPVVRIGAVAAAVGSLLALILGVSRTTLAMARDRHLPGGLAAVHPRFRSPYRAEIVVGAVVAVLASTADLRGVVGFSSFAVLVYYAIANASAFTLREKVVPVFGVIGCVLLAGALPAVSVWAGLGVIALGAFAYRVTRRPR